MQKLIYCPENCVVLDHALHERMGQTRELTLWLIKQKLLDGLDLIGFLDSLPFKAKPRSKYAMVKEALEIIHSKRA